MKFLEFMRDNLAHVLPILICGAFALALLIERARALFLVYPTKNPEAVLEQVRTLVMAGKTADALAYTQKLGDQPMAQLMSRALERQHLPEDMIQQSLEITLGEAVTRIQKRTAYLATIANIATLLGLLGTVAGLIASFEAVGSADPQQKSALLAAGISTAMNATLLGLAVAIPCMVAFSVLTNRSNQLVAELEDSALKTLDILKLRFFDRKAS